jgi:hypothetical protein
MRMIGVEYQVANGAFSNIELGHRSESHLHVLSIQLTIGLDTRPLHNALLSAHHTTVYVCVCVCVCVCVRSSIEQYTPERPYHDFD